jgi:hypothetical protein
MAVSYNAAGTIPSAANLGPLWSGLDQNLDFSRAFFVMERWCPTHRREPRLCHKSKDRDGGANHLLRLTNMSYQNNRLTTLLMAPYSLKVCSLRKKALKMGRKRAPVMTLVYVYNGAAAAATPKVRLPRIRTLEP